MRMVTKVAVAMQAVFGASADELARQTGCVRRQRKFSGASLARTMVLALLVRPSAKNRDFQAMAAKQGIIVTDEAIDHRFTEELVVFLEELLKQTVAQAVAAKPCDATLLNKFTDVRIGDSTSITLPDELAEKFPGCGGTAGASRAALKIQVLWSLVFGEILKWQMQPGRASDAQSEIAEVEPPPGSLTAFDLGYFSLSRFRRIEEASACWISRFQHGTTVLDTAGNSVDLLGFLRENGRDGLVDATVVLGGKERLRCRMIAVRVPPEVAARRRQHARDKARDHGREPSQEYLELQEWTIYLTNCAPELLTWREAIVLYRSRWQIELLFKLWKSHNRVAALQAGASLQRQMAVLYAKLIGVIVRHWMLLTATWDDTQRSLRKAAAVLREWIVLLMIVLDSSAQFATHLLRFGEAVRGSARVNRRRKHPSLFQLLKNPELLEYKIA